MYEEYVSVMGVSEFDFDGKQKTLSHTRFTTRIIESHECSGLKCILSLLLGTLSLSLKCGSGDDRKDVFDWSMPFVEAEDGFLFCTRATGLSLIVALAWPSCGND